MIKRVIGNKLITLGVKLTPPNVAPVFTPVYLDRITLLCPECKTSGEWVVPEGFRIAIAGRLLVTCDKGHSWSISGAWTEEKAKES